MTQFLLRTVAAVAFLLPCQAWSCGGTAGRYIAMTFDGQKYTITNVGRQTVTVAFTAFNTSYNLQLAPGQSASPRSPGMFGQYMTGYQSCVATPVRYR
jgi:hypothetical protein